MKRAVPTTAQARRLQQLLDEAAAEHPSHAELLHGFARVMIQQPDDGGPGLPVPVEVLVEQVVAVVVRQGPARVQAMLRQLGEA